MISGQSQSNDLRHKTIKPLIKSLLSSMVIMLLLTSSSHARVIVTGGGYCLTPVNVNYFFNGTYHNETCYRASNCSDVCGTGITVYQAPSMNWSNDTCTRQGYGPATGRPASAYECWECEPAYATSDCSPRSGYYASCPNYRCVYNLANNSPTLSATPTSVKLSIAESKFTSGDKLGTLTVNDSNSSDTVTIYVKSVTTSGKTLPSSLANSTLKNMLKLSNTTVITSGQTSGTVDWSFQPGTEKFDFLKQNEQLVLSYTIEVKDSQNATASLVLTVTLEGTECTTDNDCKDPAKKICSSEKGCVQCLDDKDCVAISEAKPYCSDENICYNDTPVISGQTEYDLDLNESNKISGTLKITDNNTEDTVFLFVKDVKVNTSTTSLTKDRLKKMISPFIVPRLISSQETTGDYNWTLTVDSKDFEKSTILEYAIEVKDKNNGSSESKLLFNITPVNKPVAIESTEGGECDLLVSDTMPTQKICKTDLMCVRDASSDSNSKTGTCISKTAKPGETCQSDYMPTQRACTDGYECVKGGMTGVSTCIIKTTGKEGERCLTGGKCTDGFICRSKPGVMDDPGSCIAEKAKNGEWCSTSSNQKRECEDGLECDMTNNYFNTGKCKVIVKTEEISDNKQTSNSSKGDYLDLASGVCGWYTYGRNWIKPYDHNAENGSKQAYDNCVQACDDIEDCTGFMFKTYSSKCDLVSHTMGICLPRKDSKEGWQEKRDTFYAKNTYQDNEKEYISYGKTCSLQTSERDYIISYNHRATNGSKEAYDNCVYGCNFLKGCTGFGFRYDSMSCLLTSVKPGKCVPDSDNPRGWQQNIRYNFYVKDTSGIDNSANDSATNNIGGSSNETSSGLLDDINNQNTNTEASTYDFKINCSNMTSSNTNFYLLNAIDKCTINPDKTLSCTLKDVCTLIE